MRLYRIIDLIGRRRKVYYRMLGEHHSTWTDRKVAATKFDYEHMVNALADKIHRQTGQIVYVEAGVGGSKGGSEAIPQTAGTTLGIFRRQK